MTILLGVSLALLVVEGGLRVLTPAWLDQRMRALNAGEPDAAGSDRHWPVVLENSRFRQFAPGSRFTAYHAEYRHPVTIDELGGRTTPHPAAPRNLVPVVGDSFAFGLGVADDETFVSLLADRSPYRLLNLGVPGSALHDQLDIVRSRHVELGRPALYVFVVFMGNDLSDIRARHRAPGDGGRRESTLAFRTNLLVVENPLLRRIYALQLVRQKALGLMHRGDIEHMDPVFLAMRLGRGYLDESRVHWRAELERLRIVSAALGFEYLLVVIPDAHQIDAGRREAKAASYGLGDEELSPERLSRTFTATLDDFDVAYFNVESCLANAATDALFYVRDNHFTPAGHAVAAGCLRDLGLMEAIDAALLPPAGSEARTPR